ncbi:MAG: HDIG domain-containing protein, partial [Candidatus Shapirobacteria bacterium]|nr:HDIG domain-containing protein [Candidatus Shapirobacteria bacterium]
MDRDQLLTIIKQRVNNENIVKHMLAMEAFMKALARYLGENEEAWGVAGLIHDLDYNSNTSAEEHGLKTREILEEEGCCLSEDIFQAVAAHNWSDNKVEPKKPADWALFSGDS